MLKKDCGDQITFEIRLATYHWGSDPGEGDDRGTTKALSLISVNIGRTLKHLDCGVKFQQESAECVKMPAAP